MTELPPGWARAPLEAIADLLDHEREPVNSSERQSRTSGKSDADLYPYYGATGQVGQIDSYRSEGERVLLGEDAAPFLDQIKDKAYLANGRFWVNNHAHVLAGAAGLIDNRFLCYQLNTVDYHPFVTGSTRLKLTSSSMRRIPMVVAPSKEQARIVERLEELLSDLDDGVAELTTAQRKLGQFRQSLLKAAVEGALTSEWRANHTPAETGAQLLERILTERRARWEAKQLARFQDQGKAPPKDWQKKYPEPARPNIDGLPPLPLGWVWASVDQCALDEESITDGPFGSNLKSSHYQETGPRVIRLQNIGDGVFVDAKAHISGAHYLALSKHSVLDGDLVVAMLGEVLPRACVVPSGVAPAIVKADCARVRINQHLVSPSIVAAQLNSKPIRDAVARHVKGIGRPRINLGDIRSIAIALCSVDEQLQVVAVLSNAQAATDQQVVAIDRSMKQTAAQRQNILRAAFAGQLVPQDPSEEHARALLERIRASRAERAKQPKARKSKQQREMTVVVRKLIEVLAEAGDWVSAQEAFRRCGVTDGAETDEVEALYAELRGLDKGGRLAVEAVTDANGRKLHDRLKLLAD